MRDDQHGSLLWRLPATPSAARIRTRLNLPAAALILGFILLLAGCGEPGSPQPPSLNLPIPIRDLSAVRTGNIVHLTWTTIEKTTDRTTPKGAVTTHICRRTGEGPCVGIADQKLQLGSPASIDDDLPHAVTTGQRAILTYSVELLNHAQKSAGPSNPAYAISGPPAEEITGLETTTRAEGVVLKWEPAPGCPGCKVSIERIRQWTVQAPSRKPGVKGFNPLATPTVASAMQTLEVASTSAVGTSEALDRTVVLGETYQYRARRVESVQFEGREFELFGEESKPVTIATRDIFPPAVPQDLAAVADGQSKAIDLSWSPDSEPGLTGYIVYRREVSGAGQPLRISGKTPLPTTSFHDAQVQSGTRYAYSVSATDQAGNESARSVEAQETLGPPE